MAESGKNVTPPELAVEERNALLAKCDAALCQIVRVLGVTTVIGVGRLAEKRARKALAAAGMDDVRVEWLMHPSPSNPQANKGWAEVAMVTLEKLDVLWTSDCPSVPAVSS